MIFTESTNLFCCNFLGQVFSHYLQISFIAKTSHKVHPCVFMFNAVTIFSFHQNASQTLQNQKTQNRINMSAKYKSVFY